MRFLPKCSNLRTVCLPESLEVRGECGIQSWCRAVWVSLWWQKLNQGHLKEQSVFSALDHPAFFFFFKKKTWFHYVGLAGFELLCRPGWSWMNRFLPACTSRALGLKVLGLTLILFFAMCLCWSPLPWCCSKNKKAVERVLFCAFPGYLALRLWLQGPLQPYFISAASRFPQVLSDAGGLPARQFLTETPASWLSYVDSAHIPISCGVNPQQPLKTKTQQLQPNNQTYVLNSQSTAD